MTSAPTTPGSNPRARQRARVSHDQRVNPSLRTTVDTVTDKLRGQASTSSPARSTRPRSLVASRRPRHAEPRSRRGHVRAPGPSKPSRGGPRWIHNRASAYSKHRVCAGRQGHRVGRAHGRRRPGRRRRCSSRRGCAPCNEYRAASAGSAWCRLSSPTAATSRWADAIFDRVLYSTAPCTGLGVLRRRPDARSHVRSTNTSDLADLQRAPPTAVAARTVRPGGRLVYSVCTLTRMETEEDIDAFAASELPVPRTIDPPECAGLGQRHRHGRGGLLLSVGRPRRRHVRPGAGTLPVGFRV